MLNNKWLAIGLSVAAVVLVLVRLVFHGTPPPAGQPVESPAPLVQPAAAAPVPPSGAATALPGTISPSLLPEIAPIDSNSDLLLHPIDRDTVEPLPRRPLGTPFGVRVFSLPAAPATPDAGTSEAAAVTTFSLQGIVREGGRRVAVINHLPVRAGDTVAGAQVLQIESNRVVLRYGEQTIELTTTPARDPEPAGGRDTP